MKRNLSYELFGKVKIVHSKEGQSNMNDFQQQTTRKMWKLTEIKQESNSEEENEDGSVKSITSYFNYQLTAIAEQEESSGRQVQDSVQLSKMASLTCQVKTEPQSEDEADSCELENTAMDYPDGFVIKREIIEVHVEDQHMIDDEVSHRKTTEDEESGTEEKSVIKSENDNFPPNLSDKNMADQKNMFHLTRQMNKQQIDKKTEISQTRGKTLCRTKKSHKCPVCGKAFHSRQACLRHKWNTHTGANPYSCEICGKVFKYLGKLQTHKTVHSNDRPFSCDLCKKTFKPKSGVNYNIEANRSNRGCYCCDLCKKLLKSKVSLKNEEKVFHSNERPYACDVCDKAFARKNNLQRHTMSCHLNERPYSCDLCKKAFTLKKNLQRHKISYHSNERPYSCNLCKETFKLKERLDRHITTVHSDERPYSCDVCNKAFKQKRTLRDHKVSHHSNERPYSCDVCKKAFIYKYVLQRHKVSCHLNERPYSCDLCNKAFTQKYVLQRHVDTCHSNERPYSCDMCNKAFKQKCTLHRHKVLCHSNEKPYLCVQEGF